jgi:hypothetical protein
MTTTLAALLGLYHGYEYLNETGIGLFATAAVTLLGLVFAVFVLVALAAAFVVRWRGECAPHRCPRRWQLDRSQWLTHAGMGRSNARTHEN